MGCNWEWTFLAERIFCQQLQAIGEPAAFRGLITLYEVFQTNTTGDNAYFAMGFCAYPIRKVVHGGIASVQSIGSD